MNPSKKDRGYVVSGAWDDDGNAGAAPTLIRLAAVAALCYGFFLMGRRVERERPRVDGPASAVVVVERSEAAKPAEAPPATAAPGQAVGEKTDVITPLNVRDPSALVMPPTGSDAPPSALVPPPPGSAPTPDALPRPSVKVFPPKDPKAKPDNRF